MNQVRNKKEMRLVSLYRRFNEFLFNGELPDPVRSDYFTLRVSSRMNVSYGFCGYRQNNKTGEMQHYISVSKYLLVDIPGYEDTFNFSFKACMTLLHEMCHLKLFLFDGCDKSGHGPRWRDLFLKVSRKHDQLNLSGKHRMMDYATKQVFEKYANCREGWRHKRYKKVASGGFVKQYKYEIVGECGFHNRINRLTWRYKAALEGIGRYTHINDKGPCDCKLMLIQNW